MHFVELGVANRLLPSFILSDDLDSLGFSYSILSRNIFINFFNYYKFKK